MNTPLIIGLSVVLALAGTLTLGKSAYEERLALQGALSAAQQEYEAGMTTIQRLPQLRKDAEQARTELSDLQREFPSSENLGVLLDQTQQLAQQSGLQIQNIARTTGPSAIPTIAEVRLSIRAQGAYPDLEAFLRAVRADRRVMNVTGFTTAGEGAQTVKLTGYVRQGE